MAYSIDWIAKVFTIPQSDLTFLSGNNYSLSLVGVHEELRRMEWSFTDGFWAPPIAKWYETVTLSGIDKTPSVEVVNGYTFDFTGSNYNVILSDYDNNLIDVYIPSNGISILANNSVGKQTITAGSGVLPADITAIADAVWDEVLTGASHNIPTSAGRRIRSLGDVVSGAVDDLAATTFSFVSDVTALHDDHYADQTLHFISGDLTGLSRIVASYNKTTKTIVFDEELPISPSNNDEFELNPIHVHTRSQVAESVWGHTDAQFLQGVVKNYKEIIEISGTKYLVIYDSGETSGGVEILRKPLKDVTGADIADLAIGTLAVEQESSA